MVRNVATVLADEHPIAMLGLVSTLLAALEPRRRGPFEPEPEPELPLREELVLAVGRSGGVEGRWGWRVLHL
ncbi:MAG: hypothetical protein ACRDTT_14085 [Pseudonocardiaceae bacterium]